MKVPISPRLLACCKFVSPGSRIADIGCDHGYLSIYLLTNKIAVSAIAADIREKPLAKAVENAVRYGVREQMTFYLSDGVQKIPQDFDTMVCAGMGGDTMISILSSAPWLKSSRYTLILQCQTKTHLLRRYLSDTGWKIQEEAILKDGKFIYTVMRVRWEPDCVLTPGQCYFPFALLNGPDELKAAHYRWITEGLRITVTGHGASADPWQVAALDELEQLSEQADLRWLKEEFK